MNKAALIKILRKTSNQLHGLARQSRGKYGDTDVHLDNMSDALSVLYKRLSDGTYESQPDVVTEETSDDRQSDLEDYLKENAQDDSSDTSERELALSDELPSVAPDALETDELPELKEGEE